MRVRLRNPDRELEVQGLARVDQLLADLEINPSTVLVTRGGELVLSWADR